MDHRIRQTFPHITSDSIMVPFADASILAALFQSPKYLTAEASGAVIRFVEALQALDRDRQRIMAKERAPTKTSFGR